MSSNNLDDIMSFNQTTTVPDVAALGTCNIDFLMKVPRFSGADDEVDIEKLKISLGGSASNFAVSLSRMDVDVGMMARVGDDNYGKFAALKLEKEGVRTDRVLKIHESTGMTFISVDPKGERSIYTSMGANAQFKLGKEDVNYIKQSKLLHLTGMYVEVVEEAAKHAQVLSLNPGTVLISYGMDDLKKIIKKAHILFLNKKEVSLLTRKDFHEGTEDLINMGIPIVVVTCGRQGASIYTSEEIYHSPSRKIESMDSTGAGDAFAAGFIAGFMEDEDLNKCLEMGNLSASSCVGKLGAVNIHHKEF